MTIQHKNPTKEARKMKKLLKKQRKQMAKLRKALEFYSRESDFKKQYYYGGDESEPNILYDEGKVARDAISEIFGNSIVNIQDKAMKHRYEQIIKSRKKD